MTFGDGVNGARLPSGTGNVVASYRYGSGKASPPAGLLTTIGQPQLNLASIQNPVPVSGGADPQTPDDVRTAAPASVSTFGRAISATDYEQIAAQAPGVNRAAASWTFDQAEQRTLVTVYVGGDPAAVEVGEHGPRRRRGPEPASRGDRRERDRAQPVLHGSWWPPASQASAVLTAAKAAAGRPVQPRPAWASGSGFTAAPSTRR